MLRSVLVPALVPFALFAAAPGAADAAEAGIQAKVVVHQGAKIEYRESRLADGTVQITGINRSKGERFRLRAKPNGWVTGRVGAQRVWFQHSREPAALAARTK